jgi:hypothetical protein
MRGALTGVGIFLTAATASAEPLRWTYRSVNEATGRVFEETGIGLVDEYIGGIPWPTQEWVTDTGSLWLYTGTETERVTIIDEASGRQATTSFSWTITESYEPHFDEQGNLVDLEGIHYDSTNTPSYWSYTAPRYVLGRNAYTVWANENVVMVLVEANVALDPDVPVETPEPGTLVLCGVAAGGGFGAWWRKRAAK